MRPICNLTETDIEGRFLFMSTSLLEFLKSHPFWAIFLIIFAILPIGGAIVHIVLKAFGRRGLDGVSSDEAVEPDDIAKDEEPKD